MIKTTVMLLKRILFLLILFSFTTPALSCNCVGGRTVQEAVAYNDGIITGTVISKSYVTIVDSTILRTFHYDSLMISKASEVLIAKYKVLLHDSFKGEFTKDTISVYSGIGTFDCGSRLKVGEKYIVYGKNETYLNQKGNGFHFPKGPNIIWTYRCLRTTLYNANELHEINRFIN